MNLISLETAVAEIKSACQNAPSPPFFFIAGAGISSPPVPMARGMIQLCQEKLRSEGRAITYTPDSAMDEYSFWFYTAYRQPISRPTFLRSLMEGKPLSRANWRLAHLLSGGQVGNVVITPNFDDMLTRALSLLGVSHVLCDHPATASRIDEDSADVQILHVHGTYRFYDCCNLSDEIEGRARAVLLSSRLDALLTRKTPLVIGYSGWGTDVIMQSLEHRISGRRLPHILYWFCYSRSAPDSLPVWLRDHVDVAFVVPPEMPPESDPAMSPVSLPSSDAHLSKTMSSHLSAHSVFDSLIAAFQVEAPLLTRDPLGFFASRLCELIVNEEEEDEEDPYLMRDVVDRINRAKERDDDSAEESEKEIETILNLLRRTEYQKANEAILLLSLDRLSLVQIEKLSDALTTALRGIENEPDVALMLNRNNQHLLNEWLRREPRGETTAS